MATPLYPGVIFTETDMSTVVDSAISSIPGFVIRAQKGPINKPILVTNEQDLKDWFGEPFNGTLGAACTFNNLKDWFSVSNFLSYSNGAYVVRAEVDAGDQAYNAALQNSGSAVDVTNLSINVLNGWDYDSSNFIASHKFTDNYLGIFAKTPGFLGNDISVAMYITDATDTVANKGGAGSGWDTWKTANVDFKEFDTYPIWSSAGKSEAAIIVYYEDVIVEKFIVSLDPDGKNQYNENYYIGDYLKKYSNYISAYFEGEAGWIAAMTTGFVKTDLVNGSLETGANFDDTDVTAALDFYSNPDEIQINFLVDGGFNSKTVADYIATIVALRKDCFGIIGARVSDIQGLTAAIATTNLITYKKTLSITGTNSTYVGFYGNIKKMYNKFQDKYFWISCSSDVAGLMARTDSAFFPWYATAGGNRGVLQNVTALGFNPTDVQIGQMYQININTIKFDPQAGNIINGNRTLYPASSAFRDINVRRLFTYCENNISRAMKFFLFEFNDTLTRSNVYSIVNNFMATIRANRGCYDYLVVCDTTNNTPDVIDNNELIISIFIKASRVIENIEIRFVATRTSQEFSELVAR